MFTLGFLNLDLDKKEEIRDAAIDIYAMVTRFFNYKYDFNPPYSHRLDKVYAFFRKKYGIELNEDEKCVFYLYIIFPDDEYFDTLLAKYNKDFVSVAKVYGLNVNIVKMRYLLQKNIKTEKENIETYKKQ